MKLKYLNTVKMSKFNLDDLSREEYDSLYNIGLERIKEDKEAIIEYAVNAILIDFITNTENKITTIQKIIKNKKVKKEDENGTKNND